MMDRTLKIGASLIAVSFSAAPDAIATANRLAATGEVPTAVRPPLDGYYKIETIGRTAQEIADAIAAIGDYHAAKSARIYDAEPLLGTALLVDGETFTWATITVLERGTDCELYVEVFDASGARPKSMPLRIVRGTIADLPTNDEVTAMVTAAIRAERAAEAAQAAKMTELQTLLGG